MIVYLIQRWRQMDFLKTEVSIDKPDERDLIFRSINEMINNNDAINEQFEKKIPLHLQCTIKIYEVNSDSGTINNTFWFTCLYYKYDGEEYRDQGYNKYKSFQYEYYDVEGTLHKREIKDIEMEDIVSSLIQRETNSPEEEVRHKKYIGAYKIEKNFGFSGNSNSEDNKQ